MYGVYIDYLKEVHIFSKFIQDHCSALFVQHPSSIMIYNTHYCSYCLCATCCLCSRPKCGEASDTLCTALRFFGSKPQKLGMLFLSEDVFIKACNFP